MMENAIQAYVKQLQALPELHVGVLAVERIPFEPALRSACEANACGMYGKNWMCPPHVGEVHALIEKARQYQSAVVLQAVYSLEDSFDFEGMMRAQTSFRKSLQRAAAISRACFQQPLILGAGVCDLCPRCAVLDEKPCRNPENAFGSLEAYGIQVSTLARLCGMKYINGVNTVTYFGAVLVMEPLPEENNR